MVALRAVAVPAANERKTGIVANFNTGTISRGPSSPFPILLLASQLIALAPDEMPTFDIARVCQTEGSSVVAPGRCKQDEGKARDQVQTEWSQFAAADKATCTRTTSTDGTPSYVELLTCLEMARDAKKLKEQQSK